MRIECDIEGIDPQPVLFAFFERVLKYAAQQVSVDPRMVDRVIVVSPERFGKAVELLKPSATHTNTETFVAAGKTFPRRDGNCVVSDIVLQRSLFGALAEVLGDPPTSLQWEIDQQQAIYVIGHEFGHAMDHSLRNDTSEVPSPLSRPFSIVGTANYYGNIVLTEYAACRNSTSAVTDQLFDHEMQESLNRMKESGGQVKYNLDNPKELTPRALAQCACQGTWFNMVELAKLYGCAVGHIGRKDNVRQLETELIEETPLGDTLDQIEKTYPNWDMANLVAQLTTVWQRYAGLFGIRFIAGNNDEPDTMKDMV